MSGRTEVTASNNEQTFHRLLLLTVGAGVVAGLLLIAYLSLHFGSLVAALVSSSMDLTYFAALTVAALFLLLLVKHNHFGRKAVSYAYGVGILALLAWACSHVDRTAPLEDAATDKTIVKPGCGITSIVIEAAGTRYLEDPRFQVYLDDQQVAQIDVPSKPSHVTTGSEALAEMKVVSADSKPFQISLPGGVMPKVVEIRYVNDLWGTPDNPGDRNLFIKGVSINGLPVPADRIRADQKAHAVTDSTGTTIFENGSLWVTGPLSEGCK